LRFVGFGLLSVVLNLFLFYSVGIATGHKHLFCQSRCLCAAMCRGCRGYWSFRLMILQLRDNYVNLRAFFSELKLEPVKAADAAD